ncbi:glycosyltransferase family 4 protein [uncultured Aquimarina sp.]|uniref:glycosyltransferase family 4 protein n=1 Tax=uncultured Aquimarina sp. TaxID=575652 RepID=UPI00262C8326|nr:glycosyltransferase family 4 protein [uncultured Aquimarina sp.]
MKILLIVDDYVPYSIKIAAKMMHELALQFITEGNEVTVITPGSSEQNNMQLNSIENLTVLRFNSGKIKNTSKIKRALNESFLSLRAYFALYSKLKGDKHDLIIYYSPTIFFGPLVTILKKKWKCTSYLILRDFFPQWAIDQKILKENSLITKYFRFFEKMNYNAADFIALQSPKNLALFSENVKSNRELSVLYNWTNDFKDDAQLIKKDYYRVKLKLENKVVFFYGGNMGKAQDMMNLVRLAKNMSVYDKAHFVFVGKGDEVELVKEAIIKYNLKNIDYLNAVDQETYQLMLSEFDIGLFSLHKLHSSHNFPGKLLGYMAHKIPVLGSINPGNDLKSIVEKANAGLISINGEDDQLMKNAIKMLNDVDFRSEMGENARELLKNDFSVENTTKKILQDIQDNIKK